MRANDFLLLEYDRNKTAQTIGNKLLNGLRREHSYFDNNFITRGKAELEINDLRMKRGEQPNPKWTPEYVAQLINEILGVIESADPTPHKEYTQWLARQYASGTVQMEDLLSNGTDWLQDYHAMKLKKILPQEYRDINKYTFLQLGDIVNVREFQDKLETQGVEHKGKSETILDNDQVRIIVPHDKESACYYGRGSRWCTAARNNNMFDHYNKQGDMYILIPKHPEHEGEKYQLHFKSSQFMNEADEPIENVYQFMTTRFGDLLPFFREKDPEINNIVIFADDALITHLTTKIREVTMDNFVNDQMSDWEMNDEGYSEYIQAEYGDEDGEIDWDAVDKNHDNWLDYNDEARRWYQTIQDVLSPTIDQVRDMAVMYGIEYDTILRIDNIEYAVVQFIGEEMNNRDSYKDELMDFIKQRVSITNDDDGNPTAIYLPPKRR